MNIQPALTWLKSNWRYLLIFTVPVILAIIPAVVQTPESKCGYVILVMAVYWMTEALPMAVTALIPIFAFPLLGILSTDDCCLAYMKQTNMMFLGGLIVAIAMEHCNLHMRIALFVILHVGQSPKRLMAGFMLTTMFLSMWISGTATTAMMVPIVNAILDELYPPKEDGEDAKSMTTEGENTADTQDCNNQMEMAHKEVENGLLEPDTQSENEKEPSSDVEARVLPKTDEEEEDAVGSEGPSKLPERVILRRTLLLGVAYAANIGGTGVVTGAAPNLVLLALLANTFSEPTGLNYATWIAFSLPGMLLNIVLAWVWLQFLFLGLFCKRSLIKTATAERKAAVRRLIISKYKELGRMNQHEITVLILFLLLVSLWLFRDPEFISGWAQAFQQDLRIGAATPVMLIVFLLFALPTKFDLPCIRRRSGGELPSTTPPACLSWEAVHEKVPWNIVLLLGGGFAIAEAAKSSGFSAWLGVQVEALSILPKGVIVLVVCVTTSFVTEVISNAAMASVLLPVLMVMTLNTNVNPLYLTLPATIGCSYSFMLPVATAPNAIVFSAGDMKTTDMMKAGAVMNVLCSFVTTLMSNTLGVAMFDLNHMPSWVNSTWEST